MTTTPLGPAVTVQPIVIRQGATFRAFYIWAEGGVAQSLEGFTGRLGVARRPGRAPIVEIHSTADEIIFEADGATGRIDFFIPPTKTQLLTRDGWYDLVLIDNNDPTEVIRLLEGPVTLDKMVTPTVVPET